MIGWRYSDRKQLLDVSDDVIVSEHAEVINKALSRLDGNGWNTDGHIHPSTCIRLRCQHAVFKERLLEQSLSGEKDSDVAHNMRFVTVLVTLHHKLTALEQYQQSVPSSGKGFQCTCAMKCMMKTLRGIGSAQE